MYEIFIILQMFELFICSTMRGGLKLSFLLQVNLVEFLHSRLNRLSFLLGFIVIERSTVTLSRHILYHDNLTWECSVPSKQLRQNVPLIKRIFSVSCARHAWLFRKVN
jgi:hypothetical protein